MSRDPSDRRASTISSCVAKYFPVVAIVPCW